MKRYRITFEIAPWCYVAAEFSAAFDERGGLIAAARVQLAERLPGVGRQLIELMPVVSIEERRA